MKKQYTLDEKIRILLKAVDNINDPEYIEYLKNKEKEKDAGRLFI